MHLTQVGYGKDGNWKDNLDLPLAWKFHREGREKDVHYSASETARQLA